MNGEYRPPVSEPILYGGVVFNDGHRVSVWSETAAPYPRIVPAVLYFAGQARALHEGSEANVFSVECLGNYILISEPRASR